MRHSKARSRSPRLSSYASLCSGSWIDLAPHQWDEETQTWTYPFESARGLRTLQVRPAARGLRWSLRGRGALGPHDRTVARSTLRRCLGLEQDFADFWSLCAQPGAPDCPLGWVAERGAGRLLRSATPFEDLLKICLLYTSDAADE